MGLPSTLRIDAGGVAPSWDAVRHGNVTFATSRRSITTGVVGAEAPRDPAPDVLAEGLVRLAEAWRTFDRAPVETGVI